MISSKKQEPEQDQSQQFGGKSPGNLDPEVSPPVIVAMRSLYHARFQYAIALRSVARRNPPSIYTSFLRYRFHVPDRAGTLRARSIVQLVAGGACDSCPRSYTEPLESD